MKNLGYYNGKTGLIEEVTVPITDRAFYFGDGVYDAVMCRNNIPYLLSEHINRLYHNCALLSINVPKTKEELAYLITQMCTRVDGEEKFVYFHVSRGSGIRNHEFTDTKGNLCIMIKPQKIDPVDEKMELCTTKDVRYSMCNIKTLNLLPSVLAAQHAKNNKCQETVFVRDGYVTECSHSNISILKDKKLITAPADCHILPGVTRAHLIESAKKNGIEVIEEKYTPSDMLSADEIIVTSSSKMARGVSKIDGKSVGGKDKKTLDLLTNDIYFDYINTTALNNFKDNMKSRG
ncbi:MAG: aminotransferase class IV [Clostridia bacterium]|nr:aminotransferase class IV [Clostridia bacterium]